MRTHTRRSPKLFIYFYNIKAINQQISRNFIFFYTEMKAKQQQNIQTDSVVRI